MTINNDESKSDFDKNLLKDPITFELFKNPKILNCGHTFDYDTLLSMQKKSLNRSIIKCPLCNKFIDISLGINNLSNNWLICNLLNIKIEKKTEKEIKPIFNKEQAKLITKNYLQTDIDKLFDSLLNDIKEASQKGFYTYEYIREFRFRKYPMEQIINIDNEIINKLTELGFNVEKTDCLYFCFICCCCYNKRRIIQWS